MKISVVHIMALVGCCIGLPRVTQAQEAVTPDTSDTSDTTGRGVMEEITVTAQRREESLQRVPIAITAITADQTQSSGIRTTEDITMLTPGLTITRGRNSVLPYLRAVGTRTALPGMENAVATYIDGVYIASQAGTAFALGDVERIEVLKGPQGTLFGRNATGGLIHVVTKTPTQNLEVEGSLGYGNYDTTTGSMHVSGGLTDNMAGSLALYAYRQGEGWGTNVVYGNDVNRSRETGGRAKIIGQMGERTTVTLSADFSHMENDLGSSSQALPGAALLGGVRMIGSIYDANTAIADPFLGGGDTIGATLKIDHELSDRITLTSLTGYRDYDIPNTVDTDGTPAVISDVMLAEKTTTIQQEFLLNGEFSKFNWTAGLFYFYSDSGIKPFVVASTPGPNNFTQYGSILTDSYAVYGQGTYGITDSTGLTLGLRYTYDKKRNNAQRFAAEGNPAPPGTIVGDTDWLPASQQEEDWSDTTFRIALDHQVTDDILIYASMDRGFKSGSYTSNAPFDPPVDPERLDAYGVGVKSELFDSTLRLNASAFYYDYSNIQLISLTLLGPVVVNAAAGRVRGAELEATWAPSLPIGSLRLNGSLSVLDSEYSDFPNATFFIPRPTDVPPFGGNIPSVADASGNSMIRAPEFSSTMSVDYSLPVSDGNDVRINVTWSHIGKFFWDPENRLAEPATDILNTQLSFGATEDGWRIRLWGKNILDEEYYGSINSSALGDTGGPAAPRTYGVAADFRFGS